MRPWVIVSMSQHRLHVVVFLLASVIGVVAGTKAEHKHAWSAPADTPASLPILQVKLAPPKHPLPQIEAVVRTLEAKRKRDEVELMADLRSLFAASLADARVRIRQLVNEALHGRHGSSFVGIGKTAVSFVDIGGEAGRRDESFAVKVRLLPVPVLDPSIQETIESIESKRAGLEQQMFQQARAEMKACTDLVLNDLGHALADQAKRLHRRAVNTSGPLPPSFLQTRIASQTGRAEGLPMQAAVRLVASDIAFPRVSDLIQNMQMRRDRAEDHERSTILEMELQLLKAENEVVKQALLEALR